jgi:hypothetical protein
MEELFKGVCDMEYICHNCIGEEYLKSYIKKNGIQHECSYCKKNKKAVEFEKIIDIIEDGFLYLYDDPINGLGWEDGEYVEGTSAVLDSYDLLSEYFDVNENVLHDLNDCFPDHQWCKKDFYHLDDSEESFYTWELLKRLTKHKIRFFFNSKNYLSDDEYSRYRSPNDLLSEIMKISNRLKLFTKLEKGTIIYRAREGCHLSSDELCSPAPEQSKYSNRFSPAGISMFYGSADKDTCAMEIGSPKNYTIGKWELLQDILIYDLTYKFQFDKGRYHYAKFPSIFDNNRRKYYHDYNFILDFASDISQAVVKGKIENIDYVPTQIVTEYLKLNKNNLKGISYYSVINSKRNFCLFIDKQQCKNEKIIKMVDSFNLTDTTIVFGNT